MGAEADVEDLNGVRGGGFSEEDMLKRLVAQKYRRRIDDRSHKSFEAHGLKGSGEKDRRVSRAVISAKSSS